MNIAIVAEDNLVIIDGLAQYFDLTVYDLPTGFWALQWQGTVGEIELKNRNQKITELPDWTTPIIAEHNRLTEEQNQQHEQEALQAVYLANGQARIERIQREQKARFDQELKTYKQKVDKLSPSL